MALAGSSISSSSSIAKIKSRMVGADALLLEMKSRLTSNARDLQTLTIVGMGGSGKTTFALNIYHEGLIQEHFDFRVWVTISQEYSIREILIQLLTQLISKPYQELSEGELEVMLHKHLYGRKYIVILDDMWSLEAWDGVKRFLPNNKNGSRIVVTTRLTTLALALPNSNSLGMTLLSEDASWDLLLETVFGEKGCCPLELEDIGKNIARACKGLPLSIVVIGGLLAKSEQAVESWKYMEENLSAVVNLEDDERCLKILYMSYKQLPVHLKPCFLYMGIYREDRVICIRDLVKLWVAEGFLKSASGKQLEDVARAYIKDLSDRNLILIHELGSIGSIKECKVHDLLRDLCLREAQKQRFYTVDPGDPRDEIPDRVSRITRSGTLTWEIEELQSLSSAPLARSLILNLARTDLPPHIIRLLRILDCSYGGSNLYLNNMHRLVNLRFFSVRSEDTDFLSSIALFWNVQTLKVHSSYQHMFIPPTDIRYMFHIRHLYFRNLHLPDPPSNAQAIGSVLENLQSLGNVHDFVGCFDTKI